MRIHLRLLLFLSSLCATATFVLAQQAAFRNAPESAAAMKNPYAGNATSIAAGKKLYLANCAMCHGNKLQGMGPAPSLTSSTVRNAKPGEVFWFITNGKVDSGMPSWSGLPKNQRWQIVSFIQSHSAEKTEGQ